MADAEKDISQNGEDEEPPIEIPNASQEPAQIPVLKSGFYLKIFIIDKNFAQ